MIEEELMDGSGHTRLIVQPALITGGKLKPYQMEGLNWLINLHEGGLNGILADEMGLGKTFQTIALIAYLTETRQMPGPHLVLGPKSTLGNWMNEVDKFCPSLKAFKFHGDRPAREEMKANEINPKKCKYDIIVTSFEMCVKEKSALQKFNFGYVIIDEAHRIKNEVSKLSQTVRQLKTSFRLLLTGTPLQNNLKELWALLNFLYPELFASADEFETLFSLSAGEDLSPSAREARNGEIVTRLHKILRPFMLRRVKSEVDVAIPPKKELLLFVPLTAMQKNLYKALLSRNVDAMQDREGGGRARLLNLAMQLRKACNHPYLFDGQEDKSLDPFGDHVVANAGKLVLLDKLLVRLFARGSRILIFSQMTRMIDILEDFCRIRNYKHCRIDGDTSGEERDRQIESFNAPGSDTPIFILSTRAGGLGINLATADIVVLYDSDWNPQVDLQAMDRAHRIGQKHPVSVFRFCHEHSIEEKVIERANTKLQLDSAIIQQGRLSDKQKQLSKGELMQMIQYGADQIFKAQGQEVTDEDIDAILQRGQQRTEEFAQKIQSHVKRSILDFSVNNSPHSNLYQFEGVDYTNEAKAADRNAWAQMGVASLEEERLTKRRVRLVQEQQEALRNIPRQVSKVPKLPPMNEWQFYDKTRINELHEVEVRHYNSGGVTTPPSPTAMEEKNRLLSLGFSDWGRRDFLAFIRGCEMCGRDNIQRIASEVEGKRLHQVIRYAEVFWQRLPELADGEKYLKRIQSGEEAILRRKELEQVILRKQNQYDHPWRQLQPCYAGHKTRSFFSEDEDRWLLNVTPVLGHGNWEKMKSHIRRDPTWRCDWFLRSRTPQEIGRRVETLIRMVKKEEDASAKKAERDRLRDDDDGGLDLNEGLSESVSQSGGRTVRGKKRSSVSVSGSTSKARKTTGKRE
eukprot:GHVN01078873.1.p1 GENE.GHVN01078873.1~~GHVN01078873.1.p1  ORF type:complete len:913 (+),score=165.91 GHVN01078873.1:262-3000(+)